MRKYIRPILALIMLTPMAFAAPMLTNGGFEESSPNAAIASWSWSTSADNTCEVSTYQPHSGRQCLKLTSRSFTTPFIYGRLVQNVPVIPSSEYELSFWVAGDTVGSGSHLTDWGTYIVNVPDGSYAWRRVSIRFTTKTNQNSIPIGLNLVNTAKALYIDDIKLAAVGTAVVADGVRTNITVPADYLANGTPLSGAISYEGSSGKSFKVHLEVTGRAGQVYDTQDSVINGDGTLPISLKVPKESSPTLLLKYTLFTSEGVRKQSITKQVRVLSAASILTQLTALSKEADHLQRLLAVCQAKKLRCDYPLATSTMLAQFMPFVKEDVKAGEFVRAQQNVTDMRHCAAKAIKELADAQANPSLAPVVMRYQSSPISIRNGAFEATRVDSFGKTSQGPVFFNGYGHFAQLRRDLDKFPKYGINIIQVEIGPNAVLIGENKVSYESIKELQGLLDRAAAHHIAVNVLISPHYFPDWAVKKWPHLTLGRGGFLGYTPDEPESKQVQAQFLKILILSIANKPALHSICLSNEPVLDNVMKARNTPELWRSYLERKYGTVGAYNSVAKGTYTSFDSIPLPDMSDRQSQGYTEYCLFNQQRFAAWHQFLADEIHRIAPKIPVHAKLMIWTLQQRETATWGTDPELFSRFSDINGNDCIFWSDTDDQWISQWIGQSIGYDLQRAFKPVPVYNSENHITVDRSTNYVNPIHYRSVLWQGAIHGQGATTIWVWERGQDKKSDFYGNVMDRPGCVDSTSRTALDLMRCADQVAALQREPAKVAIVYSVASAISSPDHINSLSSIYLSLLFSGMRVSFISDRQLSEGQGKQFKMIILPNTTRLPVKALETLNTLAATTQLVILGDMPVHDQLGNPLPTGLVDTSWMHIDNGQTPQQMRDTLQPVLSRLKVLPAIQPMDIAGKRAVWGVEWLTTKSGGKRYVNIVNWTPKPVKLNMRQDGKAVRLRVIAPLGASTTELTPGQPILAEILP